MQANYCHFTICNNGAPVKRVGDQLHIICFILKMLCFSWQQQFFLRHGSAMVCVSLLQHQGCFQVILLLPFKCIKNRMRQLIYFMLYILLQMCNNNCWGKKTPRQKSWFNHFLSHPLFSCVSLWYKYELAN